ncbi:uncharacterized protein ZBAI_00409 [Zygosaccharomyces bailii ISA1307]|nr:uncharacterized protein ZBAI_00409 [Zygosaccharomyces bailii ISA1307]
MIISTKPFKAEQLPQESQEIWEAANAITQEVETKWKKGKCYTFGQDAVQTYSITKEGELWLSRISKRHLDEKQYAQVLYYLLAVHKEEGKWVMPERSKRCLIEQEYIEVLKRVDIVEQTRGWIRINSEYELGAPLAPREFNEWVYPMQPFINEQGNEVSLVVTLVADADIKQESKDKGHIHAWYVSVERLEYDFKKQEFTWLMCTSNEAGGNIPKWLQNATIAKTVANDVPNFFDYLSKH